MFMFRSPLLYSQLHAHLPFTASTRHNIAEFRPLYFRQSSIYEICDFLGYSLATLLVLSKASERGRMRDVYIYCDNITHMSKSAPIYWYLYPGIILDSYMS